MDLLHWVLTNNYCIFDGQVYLQIKGTAMGTPVAVSYANIFLYGIETKILAKMQYTYYKRFIDDVFSIWDTPDLANSYIIQFNNVCPTIKFEAITIGRDGIMLDLSVALQERSIIFDSGHTSTYDTVTHKLYQKERNIYQYIPPISEHKKNIFENFMAQELRRYKLSCTNSEDFDVILDLFKDRLLARGYQLQSILNAISNLSSRQELLTKMKDNLQKSNLQITNKIQPIISLCVPRLYPTIKWGNIFKLPSTLINLPIFNTIFKSTKVIIGSKNPPSIGSYIIRSKYSAPT